MNPHKAKRFPILLLAMIVLGGINLQSLQASSDLQSPSAVKLGNGDYELRLTSSQRAAVDQFLKEHPQLRLPTYTEAASKNDEVPKYMKAGDEFFPRMQFPYAVWGDLNRDKFLDVAMALVTKEPVNSYGWREWWLVVFQGSASGAFRPKLVTKDQNSCLAGMFYDERMNTVTYTCFPSGIGSFHWNGKTYVAEALMGD